MVQNGHCPIWEVLGSYGKKNAETGRFGRVILKNGFFCYLWNKSDIMDIPDKYKKHIQVKKELFDKYGNYASSPSTKIVFDSELSKKVTDAVNLLEELGIYHDPAESAKASNKTNEQNAALEQKFRTIEVMSFLSVLWCFGSFYSFLIEKNIQVGLLFLSLVTITIVYCIYTIYKNK
jgi:hypothetical protein